MAKYDEPVQTELKAEFHQIKIMLSSWWDYENVVYESKLPKKYQLRCLLGKLEE